jgi:hypothetical protein
VIIEQRISVSVTLVTLQNPDDKVTLTLAPPLLVSNPDPLMTSSVADLARLYAGAGATAGANKAKRKVIRY